MVRGSWTPFSLTCGFYCPSAPRPGRLELGRTATSGGSSQRWPWSPRPARESDARPHAGPSPLQGAFTRAEGGRGEAAQGNGGAAIAAAQSVLAGSVAPPVPSFGFRRNDPANVALRPRPAVRETRLDAAGHQLQPERGEQEADWPDDDGGFPEGHGRDHEEDGAESHQRAELKALQRTRPGDGGPHCAPKVPHSVKKLSAAASPGGTGPAGHALVARSRVGAAAGRPHPGGDGAGASDDLVGVPQVLFVARFHLAGEACVLDADVH